MRFLTLLALMVLFWFAIREADQHRALNPPKSTLPHCPTNGSLCLMPDHNTTTYLEYKGDGTVWALWPDGRFIRVVPFTRFDEAYGRFLGEGSK